MTRALCSMTGYVTNEKCQSYNCPILRRARRTPQELGVDNKVRRCGSAGGQLRQGVVLQGGHRNWRSQPERTRIFSY